MAATPHRRQLSHERRVTYDAFERDDGLIDIEGTLRDAKGYEYPDRERGLLAVGQPVHDIFARVTMTPGYVVEAFDYEMIAVPFSYCHGAVDARKLIGACVLRGWRKSIDTAFGPQRGCSHLRELVYGMGTVAFQTMSPRADMRVYDVGLKDSDVSTRPFFIGGCHSWAEDSPVTERWFPQFASPRKERTPEG